MARMTGQVLAALPGAARKKRLWVDKLPDADKRDLLAMKRRLAAGKLKCSGAQLSRAISRSLRGAVKPHTIAIWLADRG